MQVQSFAFIVDIEHTKTQDALKIEVLRQAQTKFGPKAKIVEFDKQHSGTIRSLKKRGIPVIKKGGKFFLHHSMRQQLVWALVDIPMDFIVKQMGGTPGAVDLSELEAPNL